MKKLITLALLMFTYNIIYAQNEIRTVTENFLKGKVTYQYYEDTQTGNYIKHGSFQYTENQKGPSGNRTANVSGRFKDGARDGQWTFIVKMSDWGEDRGPYYTGAMNSVQTYKNGVPNGQWKITDFVKARQLVYQGNGNYTWSQYETINNESASATVKDGYTVGLSTSTTNGKTKSYTLPDDGMIKNTTIHTTDGIFKYESKYDDMGICLGTIVRGSDGKICDNTWPEDRMGSKITEEMIDNARKYLRNEIKEDELIDYGIEVQLRNKAVGGGLATFNNNYFDTDKLIKGDKTIDEGTQIYDGKYYSLSPYRPVASSLHKAYPQDIHKLPEAEQIVLLGQFASKYGHQINDLDYINKMIVQLQRSIDEKQRSINEVRMRKKTDSLLVTYNDQATKLYEQSQQEFSARLTSTNSDLTKAVENYKKEVLNQFANMKLIPNLFQNNQQVIDRMKFKQSLLNDQSKFDLAVVLNDDLNNIYIPLTNEVEQIGAFIPQVAESLSKISIKNSALNKFHQAMYGYLLLDISAQTKFPDCIEALNNLKAYSNKIMEVVIKDAKELRAILKTLKDSGSEKQRVEYILQ